jgi:hypothetical protein
MDIARTLAPALIWPLLRRGCSQGTAGAFDFGVYGMKLGHHHQAGVVGSNVSVLCVTDGVAHGDIKKNAGTVMAQEASMRPSGWSRQSNGQTSLDAPTQRHSDFANCPSQSHQGCGRQNKRACDQLFLVP